MSDLLKLNVYPTYFFVVPSTKESIKFRPFLHKEEKVLQIAKETNDIEQYLQAIKNTIKACTFDQFDVDNAPSYDIEEFFLALRSKSVGSIMDVTLICQHKNEDGTVCDGEATTNVNLDEIHVDSEKANIDEYKIKLNDEFYVQLSPPNYSTIIKLMQLRENSENVDFNHIIMTMIKSIYSEKEIYLRKDISDDELYKFIDGLTSNQVNEMLDIIKNAPTIQYKVDVECPKCHNKITYTFNGIYDFFV